MGPKRHAAPLARADEVIDETADDTGDVFIASVSTLRRRNEAEPEAIEKPQ
jgi:hypothetical protein